MSLEWKFQKMYFKCEQWLSSHGRIMSYFYFIHNSLYFSKFLSSSCLYMYPVSKILFYTKQTCLCPTHSSLDPMTVLYSELLYFQNTLPWALVASQRMIPLIAVPWFQIIVRGLTSGQLMESSPGGPNAAPHAASITLSTCSSSYIVWALISLNSPPFLVINPVPLELPSESTSRLVMEIAWQIILKCYKHCRSLFSIMSTFGPV